MLATLGELPSGPGWAFEMKWDGQRAVVETDPARTVLWSRNLNNISRSFPDLAAGIPSALAGRQAILDGEIVVLDAARRPSFSRLQRRMHVMKPNAQLVRAVPAALFVFDLLALDGQDTTPLPYLERRALLDDLDLSSPTVQCPPFWADVSGQTMLDIARENGLEGVVAKRLSSSYRAGRRSPSWVKTPLRMTASVVVVGWVTGSGGGGLGSLLLGAHNAAGNLVYIGHVGTGFSAKDRRSLLAQLEAIERPSPPCATPPRAEVGIHWVRPEIVGDIEYREFTTRLRHPSWKGLRDMSPAAVGWPGNH